MKLYALESDLKFKFNIIQLV